MPESTSYRFEGKRFLLAEDNELNAEILIELLGCRGAKVEWAENGEKAIDAFSKHPAGYYDAVFMDVMMPVMNGYEAGMDAHVAKPVDIDGLACVLGKVCG